MATLVKEVYESPTTIRKHKSVKIGQLPRPHPKPDPISHNHCASAGNTGKYEIDKDKYIFTWRIENYSYGAALKKDQRLESPIFAIDPLNKSKWCVMLYPNGYTNPDYVDCLLGRAFENYGPGEVCIGFDISFLTADGLSRFTQTIPNLVFKKGDCNGFPNFMQNTDVMAQEGGYIVDDSLTIQCQIWMCPCDSSTEIKSTTEMVVSNLYPELERPDDSFLIDYMQNVGEVEIDKLKKRLYPFNIECHAKTRYRVDERNVTLLIKDFQIKEAGFSTSFPIDSACKRDPGLYMILDFKEKDRNDMDLQFSVKIFYRNESKPAYVTCRISVIDVNRDLPISIDEKHCFDATGNNVWSIQPLTQRSVLISQQETCLPYGHLTLGIAFKISDGIELSEIQQTSYTSREKPSLVRSDIGISNLRDNLQRLYIENRVCDVTLRVNNREFQVHKCVLCAWSPVFSAMFEVNMQENLNNEVVIPDVDGDTLWKMIIYMYSETIEDMPLEPTVKLYVAADKYQVIVLKDVCRRALIQSLSIAHACHILSVADMHADDQLKAAALNFICSNSNTMFRSSEFKNMMESNVELAAETMHKVCLRKL